MIPFAYRFIFLILCSCQNENTLTSWDLSPCIVGIHLSGRSLPRRCASLLQIIESWLSNVRFKSHRLLETPSVLIYAPTRVSLCARWRVSRAEKVSGSKSVLREQSKPGG